MSEIILKQGDCLELMKDIPDKSIDMILADPPYGTTQCKWDSILPLESMWKEINRIIKNNGAILLFAGEPFASYLRISNIKNYKYDWYWNKTTPTGFLNAKKQPMRNVENICVFYKKQPLYNPQMSHGHERKISTAYHKRASKKTEDYNEHGLTTYNSTDRYPLQTLIFSTDKQKEALHPTQKPIALLEYLIKTYTNENDFILDFCMGSGSTGVAAKNLNRNFIGFELDNKYFEIAKERINNAQTEKR